MQLFRAFDYVLLNGPAERLSQVSSNLVGVRSGKLSSFPFYYVGSCHLPGIPGYH